MFWFYRCFFTSASSSIAGLPFSPPLYNAALYVDKVLSSEPIIAAYVNTLSCKKLVIPFPIVKRIEKMVFFVNKQSRGKSKKFISSYFESYLGSEMNRRYLMVLKSNLFEEFRSRKKRWNSSAQPASPQPEKKFSISRTKKRTRYAVLPPKPGTSPSLRHANRAVSRSLRIPMRVRR